MTRQKPARSLTGAAFLSRGEQVFILLLSAAKDVIIFFTTGCQVAQIYNYRRLQTTSSSSELIELHPLRR